MRRRYQLIISTFLIASVAAVVQFSFISAWPLAFNEINIVLIILIFSLFFFSRISALWLALFFGFWFDILSFSVFGIYLVSFFLTILITHRALKDWLTNRSFYSFLVLTVIANIAYSFCFYILLYLSRAGRGEFFLGEKSFWISFGWQIIWSVLAALLLFNLVAAVTKKFKPFFLENK